MHEQQRLLNVIWNDDPDLLAKSGFDLQGINIYRRNLLANAQRALSITYPTIFKLLDSDISEDLLQQFLQLSPPYQGDWAQWGENFPNFIATNIIASDYPYLPDCAHLDWQFHCAIHGQDQSLIQSSLALLGDTDPKNIHILFNENVALINTQYPIDDIFDAHHHEQLSQRDSAMKSAQMALLNGITSGTVMISRPLYQPKITRLTEVDAEFMQALMSGKSLAECLDVVNHHSTFSFEKWLLAALEQNLIYKFQKC